MKLLDIAEVSERSGVAPSALRYYEEIGLIESVGRNGLRRQFEPNAVVQLTLVAMGRAAGFTLSEIREMFGKDGRPSIPRDDLRAKAEELDRRIRELTALRDTLRHVADCPAPTHFECPKFQRLMRVAQRVKTSAKARRRLSVSGAPD